jgi:hypothetical protein
MLARAPPCWIRGNPIGIAGYIAAMLQSRTLPRRRAGRLATGIRRAKGATPHKSVAQEPRSKERLENLLQFLAVCSPIDAINARPRTTCAICVTCGDIDTPRRRDKSSKEI